MRVYQEQAFIHRPFVYMEIQKYPDSCGKAFVPTGQAE